MTVQEIIDNALSQGDNVPESDAGYIDRRRRALNFLIEIQQDVWWERDWPWKRTQADVTVLATESSAALPYNFDSLGNYGGVFRVVGALLQFPPLEEVPEVKVMEARTGNRTTSTPRVFSLFGQDPDTFQLLVQTPVASTDVLLRFFFQKKPPRLLDLGDPDQPSFTLAVGALTSVAISASQSRATVVTPSRHGFQMFDRIIVAGAVEPEYNGTFQIIVTGATTFTYVLTGLPASPATGTITVDPDVATANMALNEIPERFHVKVVLNGLKAKLRESKGDARWQKLDADFKTGKMNMKTELARFQAEVRQLPGFFGERKPTGVN